jgi:hypothetical protein
MKDDEVEEARHYDDMRDVVKEAQPLVASLMVREAQLANRSWLGDMRDGSRKQSVSPLWRPHIDCQWTQDEAQLLKIEAITASRSSFDGKTQSIEGICRAQLVCQRRPLTKQAATDVRDANPIITTSAPHPPWTPRVSTTATATSRGARRILSPPDTQSPTSRPGPPRERLLGSHCEARHGTTNMGKWCHSPHRRVFSKKLDHLGVRLVRDFITTRAAS